MTEKTKKRKSASLKRFVIFIFILFLLAFICYYLLAFYYRSGFSLNTWINGIYCTGKSVEEVNAELTADMKTPVLVFSSNSDWASDYDNVIDLAEMGYERSYLPALNAYMENQSSFLWVDNIIFNRNHIITPDISYNENAFREAFEQTCIKYYSQQQSGVYTLSISEKQGWEYYDGLTHVIDMDRAYELVKEAVAAGQYEINIDELDCFRDIPFTEEQEQTRRVWEMLEKFQNCDLVYDMGDVQELLPPSIMAYFVQYEYSKELQMDYPILDEQGELVLNQAKIREYVTYLADKYDTYGKERRFQSTRGDLIIVPADGTYGTKLDQDAEMNFLVRNLLSDEMHTGETKVRIPTYIQQGVVRGMDDIGGTYIEIDMTEQHMYYYVDWELVLDTDVVTGNTGRRMGTPQGVNYVYGKQRNRVLRGEGYATPVKFWMPVKGNVGIHDANWRSSFGGEIYKTNGSHGCINTPTDIMAQLYDMVEIGTPVIMFY